MTTSAYLGLGSNVGDRRGNLRAAVARLQTTPEITVDAVSSLYESAPVGGPPGQEAYYNAVVRVRTSLAPAELLQLAQAIEAEMGRKRRVPWGPRTIDVDLLLYGRQVVFERDLTVPHPRMHVRGFTLIPLAEIAADALHPGLQRSVAQLLDDLTEFTDEATKSVTQISDPGWAQTPGEAS